MRKRIVALAAALALGVSGVAARRSNAPVAGSIVPTYWSAMTSVPRCRKTVVMSEV